MTLQELKDAVDAANDFYFTYKNNRAGVELLIKNGKVRFNLWWGDLDLVYNDWDELIQSTVFDGKSIKELIEQKLIDVEFV